MTNLIIVGHLNKPEYLAGIGLGNTLANLVIFAFGFGLNGGVDTLVSQAFGAGELRLCGIILTRGCFVNTLFYLPMITVMFYSESLLLWLGQETLTSYWAG